jgi:hypothetical protein
MGASQERADFFNDTMLVVTRHPGGPTGRPKIHPVLPRFALFSFIFLTILVDQSADCAVLCVAWQRTGLRNPRFDRLAWPNMHLK